MRNYDGTQKIKLLTQILLLEALKANRCDYVRVLLDQGVNFDRRYLPELYEQVSVHVLDQMLD